MSDKVASDVIWWNLASWSETLHSRYESSQTGKDRLSIYTRMEIDRYPRHGTERSHLFAPSAPELN